MSWCSRGAGRGQRRRRRKGAHQEQVLLVPLHQHRDVVGAGGAVVGAPVQLQEGGGVEDAVDLRRESTAGIARGFGVAQSSHWLSLLKGMKQRPFFLLFPLFLPKSYLPTCPRTPNLKPLSSAQVTTVDSEAAGASCPLCLSHFSLQQTDRKPFLLCFFLKGRRFLPIGSFPSGTFQVLIRSQIY